MKRIISVFLACVLLACMVFTLASCGKSLSGKYKGTGLFSGITYEFSGNSFTVEANLLFATVEADGTYTVEKNEDDEWEITFTLYDGEENADDVSDFVGTFSFNEGSDNDGKYIEIGGIKYYRQ